MDLSLNARLLLSQHLHPMDLHDAGHFLDDDEKQRINEHITDDTAEPWTAYIRSRLTRGAPA